MLKYDFVLIKNIYNQIMQLESTVVDKGSVGTVVKPPGGKLTSKINARKYQIH